MAREIRITNGREEGASQKRMFMAIWNSVRPFITLDCRDVREPWVRPICKMRFFPASKLRGAVPGIGPVFNRTNHLLRG